MAAAGLPTAGGKIPLADVVMDVLRRRSERVARTLAVVEDLLAEDGTASRIAVDCIENMQNVASHGAEDLYVVEDLLPLRGPRTVTAWQAVDQFWDAAVAWCDENGVELTSSESLRAIRHPSLRAIMWPACRSLPDGRQMGHSDVLRYELAADAPMGGVGHGSTV